MKNYTLKEVATRNPIIPKQRLIRALPEKSKVSVPPLVTPNIQTAAAIFPTNQTTTLKP